MKKFYIGLFILLAVSVGLSINYNAKATSGACSSHGGDNCGAGPDTDGSIICNDGWRDSTVDFYAADECKPNITCSSPSTSGYSCTTENDYNTLQSRLLSSGGSLGYNSFSQGNLSACRADITAYQSKQQEYQNCLSTQQAQANNYYSGMQQETTRLKQQADTNTNTDNQKIANGIQICQSILPNSVYNVALNDCKCQDDYTYSPVGTYGQCTKKVFVATTTSQTLFSTPISSSNPASNAHPVGTNIKFSGGEIDMIAPNGTLRPYTSAGAFLSYGFNSWSTVVDANLADTLSSMGNFIPPRDGKIVCSDRGTDKGTCYLISGSKKAGFTSAKVFTGLGFSFKNTTNGDMSWMDSTSNIDNAQAAHLPGVLIKNNGSYQLVVNGGVLDTTLDMANSWGYLASDVITANTADLILNNLGSLKARQPGELIPKN